MANPSIQQTRLLTDPSLKDLMDLVKKDIMLSLNCHAIATVESFDPENITVTATINYTKTYFKVDPTTNISSPYQVSYPLLMDCPAIILSGGTAGVSFPISPGDQCLILFNDRDIDNWFAGATTGPVATPRYHSLSDALALVGFPDTLAAYDPNRAVLFNGTTGVGVSSSKVKIFNQLFTLNTLLQNILTQLEVLANTVSVPGNPLNPAVATALTALGVQLGELLE